MLEAILNGKKIDGQHDLESVEMLTRTVMHKVGSVVLEKIINLNGGGSREQIQECERGHNAVFVEVREKELMTVLGKVRVKRNYYYDSDCRQGWCPKDRELGIEGSSFSPGLRRIMGRVGSSRPFALSEEDILEIAGLNVNSKAIERNCHELGKEAEIFVSQIQDDEANNSIDTMYISMDGTGVPVVKAETVGRIGKGADGQAKTREAKLGCVFTQTRLDKEGYPVRDEQSTTYVGAIEKAEDFSRRMYAEANRRGFERAKRVCVIGDGAAWIWNIVQDNFWNAIQIVDIYHAREHYWNCARIVFGSNSQRQRPWAQERQKELDSGNVEAVIKALKRLRPKNEETKKIRDSTVKYFEQNKERMRYNVFRAQGLFIGSGVIEAGCRSVIGQRLKQSGMHWTVSGANSIIALRCCLLSRRWEDFWDFRAAA